jgi:iron complex transport system ATP-binding protein
VTPALLEANALSFSYGGGFTLEGFSLRLEAGECLVLAGPNGAGKSTLLKLLAGILPPAAGTVTGLGQDLARLSPRRRARQVAWVPQEMDALFPVTVEEAVRMGFFPRSGAGGWAAPADTAETLEKVLALLDLSSLRRRDVRRLSGGERRRVLLARGLAQGAKVLLLDEPTSHLDPRHQADLVEAVERLRREEGTAVVAALHDLGLALALSGRTLLLAGGRPAAEGPTESVLTPPLLEKVYGLPAEILKDGRGRPAHVRFSLH